MTPFDPAWLDRMCNNRALVPDHCLPSVAGYGADPSRTTLALQLLDLA